MHFFLFAVISLSSLLPLQTLGILRPSASESDRRQGSTIGNQNPETVQRPGPIQSTQQLSPPSRELLPPLVAPLGPVINSNDISTIPASGQPVQLANQNQPTSEKYELLPPVEIPPEYPIDNPSPLQNFPLVQPNSPERFHTPNTDFKRGVAPPIIPLQFQPSSFFQTSGPGLSVGSISNSQRPQRPNQPARISSEPKNVQQLNDPGLDCLGKCDCPPDFNFVCGNNRFLYQNDCALECDKKCHPSLIKVSMDNCSRKK